MRKIVSLEKEIAFKTMIGEITSIALEQDLTFINDSEIEGNLMINGTYKMTEASTIIEDFAYKIPVEIMLTTALEEDKRSIAINNFTYKIVNDDALELNIELLIEGLEKIDLKEIEVEEEEKVVEELEEVPTVLESAKEELVRGKEEREENKDETEGKGKDFEEPEEIAKEPSVLETEKSNSEREIEVLSTSNNQEELPNIEQITKVTEQVKENVEKNNEVMDSIFSAFANTKETYSTYSVYILRENDVLEDVISKYKTTREALSEYNDLENLKIGSKLIIPTSLENDG